MGGPVSQILKPITEVFEEVAAPVVDSGTKLSGSTRGAVIAHAESRSSYSFEIVIKNSGLFFT